LPNFAAAKGFMAMCIIAYSKDFPESGKKRLDGDIVREATSDQVKSLREENNQLKQAVADLLLKNRVLNKV
jgi:transposase